MCRESRGFPLSGVPTLVSQGVPPLQAHPFSGLLLLQAPFTPNLSGSPLTRPPFQGQGLHSTFRCWYRAIGTWFRGPPSPTHPAAAPGHPPKRKTPPRIPAVSTQRGFRVSFGLLQDPNIALPAPSRKKRNRNPQKILRVSSKYPSLLKKNPCRDRPRYSERGPPPRSPAGCGG